MEINNVDICCGLAWGDEAKGKIVSELLKKNKYNFVCRWSGGSNAGHTIYINNKKYHTHIVPAGIFHNITSVIGRDCYINMKRFDEEMNYLKFNGFNTDLVKISPYAHIITDEHIDEDRTLNFDNKNSTGNGIAKCARDKYDRKGILVKDGIWTKYKSNILDFELYGDILCEGAQGFWLDINYGNYPYVTSSNTLPYSACSLGFPPQKIRNIYGAVKIYDTRVGNDPLFNNDKYDEDVLNDLSILGHEYGTTTGRRRTTKWLNVDKLINSINISGCTILIVSKIDIIKKLGIFKLQINHIHRLYECFKDMIEDLNSYLMQNCKLLTQIIYSDNPKYIKNL